MAIDKQRARQLIEGIDVVFNETAGRFSVAGLDFKDIIRKTVIGPAFKEINELITEGRPPRIYLLGRSGHGKSSLINGLANKTVARVGDIEPTTAKATVYKIIFADTFSEWEVIDSRGIFETNSPQGASPINACEQVKEDVGTYKPDVIFHVLAASEARSLEKDLVVLREVADVCRQQLGSMVSIIIILNKTDCLGNRKDWPPEISHSKAAKINELLDFMSKPLGAKSEPLDITIPFKGRKVLGNDYVGIIPVCSFQDEHDDERWNIDTLSMFVGEYLPRCALLDFYQAQRRKELLRRLSTSIVNRFSAISGAIGGTPTPITDPIILGPLQLLMIAVIAGLACRSFSIDVAREYLSAHGVAIGAAFGGTALVRNLAEWSLPGVGLVISGAIAAATTYGIGKAAEAYFFSGELRRPEEFKAVELAPLQNSGRVA